MNRIQLSANLYLDEYIPKDIYLQYQNDTDVLIRKLNPKLIEVDQKLRDHFGPVRINTWWEGGPKIYSGWRPADCPEGAKLSDHHEGNASDKEFDHVTAEEVRKWIIEHFNWQFLGITVIESGRSWVHSSVAWTKRNSLWIVNPNT